MFTRIAVMLVRSLWRFPESEAAQLLQRTLVLLCVLLTVLSEHALTQSNPQSTLSATYLLNFDQTVALAVADLNGDGHPDLVVSAYCLTFPNVLCTQGAIGVLLGNADGTFQPMVTYSLPFLDVVSIIVADMNGDGHPDLIIESGANADIGVMLGNGDGTFRPVVVVSDTLIYTVADVNGDHFPDLILGACLNSNCSQQGVGVRLNNGDGTFGQVITYDSGGQPNSGVGAITVADVNGDGYPDLLVANSCNSVSVCSNGTVGVLLGNGDGTFKAPFSYDSGGGEATDNSSISNSIVVGDVNGDGHPDLLVANSCVRKGDGCVNATVGVLLGNGEGTFQEAKVFPLDGQVVQGLALSALGGGPLLIASSNCEYAACTLNNIDVGLSNGDGTFQRTFQQQTNSSPNGNPFLRVADLNGDGLPDLVVANYCGIGGCSQQISTVGVFLGMGKGGFQQPVNYSSGGAASIQSMQVVDVNGDGHPDLIAVNQCAYYYGNGCEKGSAAVLLGNGDGTFPQGTYPASTFLSDSNVFGQSVTLTSIILSDGATPTGAVTFYDGSVKLGTTDLVDGAASYTTSTLQVGNHSITAMYSGDANDSASIGSWPQFVYSSVTTTTLVSTSSQSYVNQPVTFTASVEGQYGGIPTGSITFTISGNKPVTVPLSNGQATFAWTFLYAGPRTVTASYSGDSNYVRSTSTLFTQQVNPLSATETSLTSSANPSLVNQTVTYTASVTGQNGSVPTGTVTFDINSNKPVTVPLNNGQATFTWAFLYAGPHSVTAAYSGDTANAASVSSALNQTVNTQPTQTALSSSLNPSAVNQTVTYTASVTGQNGSVPTGSVTFDINSNKPVTVPLNNGQATFTWTFLYAGPHAVTATYSGDSASAASVSSILNQTVNTQTTQTALSSSLNSSTVNQTVSFTAAVAGQYGGIPTGSITFTISGNQPVTVSLNNGQATFNWTFLYGGERTVSASYSGDANDQASVATMNQTVNPVN